jgi:homocitrate synthase
LYSVLVLLYLLYYYYLHTTMCPPPDAPMNGNDEMVAIDTNQPSLPPPAQTGASEISTDADAPVAGTPNGLVSNGEHSHPPAVKSHKGVYGRASDFLSNTSNWQVCAYSRTIRRMSKRWS